MAKEELIQFEGLVTEILPDARYRVQLDAGHEIVAYTAGKMKKNRIKTLAGDRVTIEMSPYDLEKGRLIFRHKDERPTGTGGTLVFVTENQPALLEVIGRHLDRHPVSGQRLDPVLLHFSGGVGHDLVACIELHAIAGVGQDFGDQSFELDQLFFSHGVLQIDRRLVWLLFAVGLMVRPAFAMQKGN